MLPMFRWELEHMSVTDRMHALGDHAKSSRQPPLRPRPTAGGDLAAGSHFIDDNSFTSQPIDDDEMKALLRQAIEDRADDTTIAAIADADVAQRIPSEAHQATNQSVVSESDDHLAARRAIIHEWENWSALHTDELEDINAGKYFFEHLRKKKSHLLGFASDDGWGTVHGWLVQAGRIGA
jgi:hypothetical protein